MAGQLDMGDTINPPLTTIDTAYLLSARHERHDISSIKTVHKKANICLLTVQLD